jgi:hypothetical protein
MLHPRFSFILIALVLASPACNEPRIRPGDELDRRGDEIVVCGRLFHTGTRVVLWTDPDGFDAYRVHRRFDKPDVIKPSQPVEGGETPNRYSPLREGLTPAITRRVQERGWTIDDLSQVVDKFVIHYDACGTSRRCFEVLHDMRGLSVHFLLDLDGTIYQTLDVKERARHAGPANDRSVGVEIAHIGAHPTLDGLADWYKADALGVVRVTPPADWKPLDGGSSSTPLALRPARPGLVAGHVNGVDLLQYDFTPQQYEALARLTATLTRVLPRISMDYPRDGSNVRTTAMGSEELRRFRGLIGHCHITGDKYDPGPAFDWDRLIRDARAVQR